MLRRLLSTLLFLSLSMSVAFAQSGSITGTVTDAESGDPVPTANVLLVELQSGTATNVDGEYTINNVTPGTYTLRVTFVGYQTYRSQVTIEAGEETVHDVELQSGAIGLDELVVTGYGVESKRELTGSISKVSSEDFEDVAVQNTAGLLQGRAAGVQITSTSGQPGGGYNVQIRGDGSINAGNDPLWIVDGVQLSFSNTSEEVDDTPLNSINPNDIESIEVLKDAAAAAIYGAQASNGVVIITTKRGQQGDTQINASVEQGIRTPVKMWNTLNAQEWLRYQEDAYSNVGFDGRSVVINSIIPSFGYPAGTGYDGVEYTDWQDFIYRQGHSQKYNVSASGGSEQTRFYIGGGYEKTLGQVKDSNFQRYNMRTNFDHQFTDRLNGRININLSTNTFGGVGEDSPSISQPLSQAVFQAPIDRPYLPNGDYNPNTTFGGLATNPAVVFDFEEITTDNVTILGNLSLTYQFDDWISLTTLWGLDWRSVRDKFFGPPITYPSDNGYINESVATTFNFNTNTVLNMRQTFNEVHNVSGLIGGEYRRDYTREVESSSIGLPSGLFNVQDAAASPTLSSSFFNEYRIASYFGQAKYNYNEKYFVNFTARYDGSSRFGSDRRWGFFPSASVAWRVSEEDFFNADFVEDLKIRASYGVTGNAQIGNFAARGLYGTSGSYSGTTGLRPSQLANNRLTWEEAREINLGLDFALWRSRVSGSIDFYQKDNENLLLGRPLPEDSGYGSITENVGAVRNEGIEFEVSTVNMDRGDFLWTSRANFAVQRNTVLELVGDQEQLGTSIFVGHPLGVHYLPLWAGVNPADGRPMWYDDAGNITYDPSSSDDTFFDGTEQDLIGGFGNRFSYKGLSLDVFFQYSFGQMAIPYDMWYFMQTPIFGTNVVSTVLDRWQEPGDMTYFPKVYAYTTSHPSTSNYRVEIASNSVYDSSYIRLKNMTLSYNLPTSLIEKLNLRGVRIYATGLNLMTWTSWPGTDPENVSYGYYSYPTAKQINGGIELQF